MGQKTHPKIFRIGIIETWDSKWYADRDYSQLLHEDFKIKKFIKGRLFHAGISKIEIERATNKAKINIHTARPGIVIGKKGAEIEKLKGELSRLTSREIYINIHEVRRPDLDGQLVAENVALQLQRRVAFRRAMKESVSRALRMGAQGIRVQCSGRLGVDYLDCHLYFLFTVLRINKTPLLPPGTAPFTKRRFDSSRI